MYIHNYQIHNVLNEYRKLLSQAPVAKGRQKRQGESLQDRVEISGLGQRNSIFDQVSSTIVERITQTRSENNLDEILLDYLKPPEKGAADESSKGEHEFTYTFIDEDNRKIINTLSISRLSPASRRADKQTEGEAAFRHPSHMERLSPSDAKGD